MKIKIGEREYITPFRYNPNSGYVVDNNGQQVCDLAISPVSHFDEVGQFIVSALNDREEKTAAILKEREEIIAMLTDGSYCRASEHKRNICVCPEFRKDIRARDLPSAYEEAK
jgi:hypothetical protein